MYDSATTSLIQAVVALDGLDRERLPAILTDAFARIVAARIRHATGGPLPEEYAGELAAEISNLRKLANTYETLACLLNGQERRACAFVAATAHQLLQRIFGIHAELHVTDSGVSSSISSILLFILAGMFPDATEAASRMQLSPARSIEVTLASGVANLGLGRPDLVLALPAPTADPVPALDLDELAVRQLWGRTLEGMRLLAQDLLSAPAARSGRAVDTFLQVKRLSRLEVSLDLDGPPSTNTFRVFGGPHHLATLLAAAGEAMLDSAVTSLSPPSGDIPADQWQAVLEKIASKRPCLWPNHIDAVHRGFLENDKSSVVSFPTGAGKSTLVQLKIATALLRSKGVVFLVPTHALVDQVVGDLRSVFSREQINATTLADEVDEAQAQVDVMTPERCLARWGTYPERFADVGLLVFDECHLLNGATRDRRSLDAMLCLLTLLNALACDVVLLSAMMANAGDLAAWLTESHGRAAISLDSDWKPTRQVRGCLVYLHTEIERLTTLLAQLREADRVAAATAGKLWKDKPGAAVQRQLNAQPYALFSLLQTWNTRRTTDYLLRSLTVDQVPLTASKGRGWYLTPNRNRVSATLGGTFARAGIKTMILSQAPKDLPSLADSVRSALSIDDDPLHPNERDLLEQITDEFGELSCAQIPERGVAIHHGLMIPAERRLAERMFARGASRVLVVSPTMSQGVNLPAEAIIIAGDDRWDVAHDSRAALAAHELLNAAGRAGRAGSSALGIVVVVPGTIIQFDDSQGRIGESWLRLQERVFSKSDQCLTIEDPLQFWLDELHSMAHELALPESALYFLTRLPVSEYLDSDTQAREFLSSSLAAYHARRRGSEARFATLMSTALTLRVQHSGRTGEWHDAVSSKAGIPVDVIRDLDLALQGTDHPTDVLGWVEWWFAWAGQSSRRSLLLLREVLERLFALPKDATAVSGAMLSELKALLLGWMSGETLKQLETRLGSRSIGTCNKAREFAMRHVSTVAFAIGMTATVLRARGQYEAAEADSDPPPLPMPLSIVQGCVRDGFSTAEAYAYYLHVELTGARVTCHRRFRDIEGLITAGGDDELFRDVLRRVRVALR